MITEQEELELRRRSRWARSRTTHLGKHANWKPKIIEEAKSNTVTSYLLKNNFSACILRESNYWDYFTQHNGGECTRKTEENVLEKRENTRQKVNNYYASME
jgi:hypothetical protein